MTFLKQFACVAGILILLSLPAIAQNTLSGKVTDSKDGSFLIGATIRIPEAKTGGITDESGSYSVKNLPSGNFLVEITYLGYSTLTQRVSIKGATKQDFALSTSVIEQNEVIITGVSTATEIKHTVTPMSVLSSKDLQLSTSPNLIDAIAKQPGISQVTTGSGISKPVIRGLGYNRVVVMNDGIRQEGQQWGDEHGIEIDEYAANKVEVLKGPGSIMYGSDAMAGVINILSPDPVAMGQIKGSLLGNYRTKNSMPLFSFF